MGIRNPCLIFCCAAQYFDDINVSLLSFVAVQPVTAIHAPETSTSRLFATSQIAVSPTFGPSTKLSCPRMLYSGDTHHSYSLETLMQMA